MYHQYNQLASLWAEKIIMSTVEATNVEDRIEFLIRDHKEAMQRIEDSYRNIKCNTKSERANRCLAYCDAAAAAEAAFDTGMAACGQHGVNASQGRIQAATDIAYAKDRAAHRADIDKNVYNAVVAVIAARAALELDARTRESLEHVMTAASTITALLTAAYQSALAAQTAASLVVQHNRGAEFFVDVVLRDIS